MKQKDPNTFDDTFKAAWSALLRGDTAERDRQCARAEKLLEAERYAEAVTKVLSVDFYVTRAGVSISTKQMAKAAGAING